MQSSVIPISGNGAWMAIDCRFQTVTVIYTESCSMLIINDVIVLNTCNLITVIDIAL